MTNDQMTNDETKASVNALMFGLSNIRHSDLIRHSSFEFRHFTTLCALCAPQWSLWLNPVPLSRFKSLSSRHRASEMLDAPDADPVNCCERASRTFDESTYCSDIPARPSVISNASARRWKPVGRQSRSLISLPALPRSPAPFCTGGTDADLKSVSPPSISIASALYETHQFLPTGI